jgi:hypothetical protein
LNAVAVDQRHARLQLLAGLLARALAGTDWGSDVSRFHQGLFQFNEL